MKRIYTSPLGPCTAARLVGLGDEMSLRQIDCNSTTGVLIGIDNLAMIEDIDVTTTQA